MTSKYVLVNIGCIECGVSSNLVGTFTDKINAESICYRLNSSIESSWRESGQNNYVIFKTLEDNVINDEYMQYLTK